ncbi:MAG: hypothetical protein KDA90_07255 [Planctomycetaceae bacterium]|nr:hypothetical protein [Planctomycetaceae bacterium]
MRRNLAVSGLLLCLFAAGCSGYVPAPTVEREPAGSPKQLAKDLQLIADEGVGESALQPVVMGMEALDPGFPKKAELDSAYKKLMTARSADKRKEIATEMLGIVNSVSPSADAE